LSYGRIKPNKLHLNQKVFAIIPASSLYEGDARSSHRSQIGVVPPALKANALKTLGFTQLSYGRIKPNKLHLNQKVFAIIPAFSLYEGDARSSHRSQIGVVPPALKANALKTLGFTQLSYGRTKRG